MNSHPIRRVFLTGGSGFLGRNLLAELHSRGIETRTLARSPHSQSVVQELGATPIAGDLEEIETLKAAMEGCDTVIHAASLVAAWGREEDFYRVNVIGTHNVLQAARAAGVARLVHVSTQAVLVRGTPIINVDESVPIPDDPLPGYPRTKALAELLVRQANGSDLQTIIVRLPMVWGAGDTTFLPTIEAAVRSHRWAWINGRYRSSTGHVRNMVEGILLAAERGGGGETYFLTDGEPIQFREFVRGMLEARGLKAGRISLYRLIADAVAVGGETLWRTLRLPGSPPLTRTFIGVYGLEVTSDDSKARRELGYRAAVSREQGLEAMH